MKYLLDTCVISELAKPKPDNRVISWIIKNDEDNFYLSSLTFGELYKGISKLIDSKRKNRLYSWIEKELKERFKNKILDIDLSVAYLWGNMEGRLEAKGIVLPAIDSLIAATGITYNLTIVTRNVADMKESGVRIINPWIE